MTGAKLYTQDELEDVFRRRQRDQEDLIGKVADRAVAKIKPEFEAVNTRLDGLTEQVRKTNGQVAKHGELFRDMGVADLSQEERQALPEVLEEHVRIKENRKNLDRLERRRVVRQQFVTTFVSTASAVVLAGLGIYGFLRATGVIH